MPLTEKQGDNWWEQDRQRELQLGGHPARRLNPQGEAVCKRSIKNNTQGKALHKVTSLQKELY